LTDAPPPCVAATILTQALGVVCSLLFGGKRAKCAITSDEARRAVTACYKKHNNKPGLANVSTLVKDYEGHYDQLYAALKTKYGADALAPAGDENKKDK
jgi:hypothetical protein